MYMAMRKLDLVSEKTPKAGFSLLELLTVISVISLLMGIMLFNQMTGQMFLLIGKMVIYI